jgi:hypothetical protein
MVRIKPLRRLAAAAFAVALLSAPSLAAAAPGRAEDAAHQEGLWARFLAWLPEAPLVSFWTYSSDIDPDGRPTSTGSEMATPDSSADIDPNG